MHEHPDSIIDLLRREVVREGAVPLTQQIRAAIQLSVLLGEFGGGLRLPSVRLLSRALGLAPGTVSRAYQALVSEGLVRSRARRGFFTADVSTATRSPSRLADLMDETISASEGIDPRLVLRMFADRLRSRRRAKRRVTVLGYKSSALEERVTMLRAALRDLGVEVTGLSYDELRSAPHSPPADVYVVPVLETKHAAALLGPHAHRIVPMTRRLHDSVSEFIAGQPEDTRFGVISVDEDALSRTLAGLRRGHPLNRAPLTATARDKRRVANILNSVDALIIGPVAATKLERFLPFRIPHAVFTLVPDDESISRIRARLGPGRQPASGDRVAHATSAATSSARTSRRQVDTRLRRLH